MSGRKVAVVSTPSVMDLLGGAAVSTTAVAVGGVVLTARAAAAALEAERKQRHRSQIKKSQRLLSSHFATIQGMEAATSDDRSRVAAESKAAAGLSIPEELQSLERAAGRAAEHERAAWNIVDAARRRQSVIDSIGQLSRTLLDGLDEAQLKAKAEGLRPGLEMLRRELLEGHVDGGDGEKRLGVLEETIGVFKTAQRCIVDGREELGQYDPSLIDVVPFEQRLVQGILEDPEHASRVLTTMRREIDAAADKLLQEIEDKERKKRFEQNANKAASFKKLKVLQLKGDPLCVRGKFVAPAEEANYRQAVTKARLAIDDDTERHLRFDGHLEAVSRAIETLASVTTEPGKSREFAIATREREQAALLRDLALVQTLITEPSTARIKDQIAALLSVTDSGFEAASSNIRRTLREAVAAGKLARSVRSSDISRSPITDLIRRIGREQNVAWDASTERALEDGDLTGILRGELRQTGEPFEFQIKKRDDGLELHKIDDGHGPACRAFDDLASGLAELASLDTVVVTEEETEQSYVLHGGKVEEASARDEDALRQRGMGGH